MKKITATTLLQMKQAQQRFACLTAYDASFAQLFDQAGVHAMLVGDSLGMVLQGQSDTVTVTVDDIAYHTRCVRATTQRALVIADLPFLSYATPEQAYANAARMMQAGANMVKLEGGAWLNETITGLTDRGIPVCGHLGLTPQSVHLLGGFKVQGRDQGQAEQMVEHARGLQAAGVQLLVVECIPVALAEQITKAVDIPVIGIGAGPVTDGQILVMHDVLGITAGHIPKFSKNYLAQTGDIRSAIETYVQEVAEGRFPAQEHSFK